MLFWNRVALRSGVVDAEHGRSVGIPKREPVERSGRGPRRVHDRACGHVEHRFRGRVGATVAGVLAELGAEQREWLVDRQLFGVQTRADIDR